MSPDSATLIQPPSAGPAPLHNGNGAPKPLDESNQQGHRIQELIEQIDALPDLDARALVQECLQSVLALHGQGLARVLQLVQDAGAEGQKILDQFLHDEAVRSLLLIHGLHPVDLATRLDQALSKVRPYMESHGGNVELISLENDVARLRLQGACKTCPSSTVTMELAVRRAIEEACPDLMGFELEGVAETADSHVPHAAPAWTTVDGLGHLNNCDTTAVELNGVSLIICKVNETFYAYRNLCPACGVSFAPGGLDEGCLKCPLGHRFDAQHAGKCIDNETFHLDPFPLLAQNGQVKVWVG